MQLVFKYMHKDCAMKVSCSTHNPTNFNDKITIMLSKKKF